MFSFAPFNTLFFGALFGLLFGFFLRRAHVTRFHTIVSQLLLNDFTVMKVIFTAIIVGGAGVYFMLSQGLISSLILSETALGAIAVGGGIFGVGMATLGYCPGTCIASLADGSRDAPYGLLGMIFGVALYEVLYPWINAHFALSATNPQTFVSLTHLPAWFFTVALGLFAITFFTWLGKAKKGVCA